MRVSELLELQGGLGLGVWASHRRRLLGTPRDMCGLWQVEGSSFGIM